MARGTTEPKSPLYWRDRCQAAERERDRAVETRENANAVSLRYEQALRSVIVNLDGQTIDGNIFPAAALRIAREGARAMTNVRATPHDGEEPTVARDTAVAGEERMTRRKALTYYALSMAVLLAYDLGYVLGSRADEPNGLAVQLGVTCSPATVLFVVNLWRAAR